MTQGGVIQNPPMPPHGLKPRVAVPVDWVHIGLIVAGLLLLGLLLWWGWRIWRKRSSVQEPDALPVAGQGRISGLISELRAISLPQSAEPFSDEMREDFYWRLSLAFRTAIEWRTGIAATTQTIAELRGPLAAKLPLPRREATEALQFLEAAEFIKFANKPATVEEAESARATVIRLIGKLFPGEVSTL